MGQHSGFQSNESGSRAWLGGAQQLQARPVLPLQQSLLPEPFLFNLPIPYNVPKKRSQRRGKMKADYAPSYSKSLLSKLCKGKEMLIKWEMKFNF